MGELLDKNRNNNPVHILLNLFRKNQSSLEKKEYI